VTPFVLCAGLLAGCGGDGDGGSKPRAEAVPAGEPARVTADEYSFDPDRLSVASGRVRIVLKNDGSVAHNLKVLKDGEEVGGTPTFVGGESRSATLRLRPGRYEMVCTVGDHEQLGMRGTLVVR
jgi:plastocyanin